MGIFFSNKTPPKFEYYNLLGKSMKNIYYKNRYNAFNLAYSLHLNKFTQRRNSTKLYYNRNFNNGIYWKTFLLTNLEVSFSNYSWEKSLYNFIYSEKFPNEYIFQNRIFFEEFSFLSKPKLDKKEESLHSLSNEPILSSLDTKELKSLSKSILSYCLSPYLIENEIDQFSDNKYDQHLTMDISMESITSSMINNDPKYEAKFNSYKIKKYIQIIKKHLDKKNHPIIAIINEFIKLFSPCLKEAAKFCEENKLNKNECFKKGKEIVKQIQSFIEIMQGVLKLFYSKSINYRYFIDEKDEIINLISYIFFNDHTIYKYVKSIFRSINYEKILNLEEQFNKLGDLTPKEMGIDPKFCLDKETDKYMEQIKFNKINVDKRNNSFANIADKTNEINIYKNNQNLSKRRSKLVEFFESQNKKSSSSNVTETEKNLDEDSEDNFSINTEKSLKQKTKFRYKGNNRNNPFIDDDEEDYMHTYSLEDFRKNIESFQDRMNIKELLIDKIGSEGYPNLPKIPTSSQKKSKEPYLDAINYLRQIDTYKAPLEKLIVISLISVIITDCVDNYWESLRNEISSKLLNIDADELMSIYLYIIYKLKSPSLFVHLDFIKYFTTPISKQSMIGYYFTALEGCLNFILNIKDKNSLTKN